MYSLIKTMIKFLMLLINANNKNSWNIEIIDKNNAKIINANFSSNESKNKTNLNMLIDKKCK